jgi:TPP-dependent pyruvate/acetoin dehydrogenase alpha subunit
VLENNHIAQTTPTELAVAGSIPDRFRAFNIPAKELDTADVREIMAAAADLLSRVRQASSPQALIINTRRFGPHSKGDDTRDPAVIDSMRTIFDPIKIQAARLNADDKKTIHAEVDEEIKNAYEQAANDPFPSFV